MDSNPKCRNSGPNAHVPLLAFTRNGFTEAVHRGSVAVVGSDGRLHTSIGDPEHPTVLRSAAKPLQLMTVLASGAAERFGLTDRELAVAAASHSAEPEHLEAVRSILRKIGRAESELRCGVHPPFMPHVARSLARAGESPSEIHNNCSGKHAAMLAACSARGWPAEGYDDLEHPLQRENLRRVAIFADLPEGDVGVAGDGCGVPTFVIPLWRAALAYARIADPEMAPEGERRFARRAMQVISANPSCGSGSRGRLEAALVEAGGGRLVVKVGAEGLYTVGIAPGVLGDRGYGLALKLGEGITFNRATDPIVLAALEQLGVLESVQTERLSEFRPMEVRNCRGEPVGRLQILFKLDPIQPA